MHLSRAFEVAVQRAALATDANVDFFEMLRQRAAAVPQRELERVKRAWMLEGSRLNTTHPPTGYRIKLLQARPFAEPEILFTAADFEQLETELFRQRERIQRKLMDNFRARLYRR
jgi:hypothetical protein